ncbi:MAG: tRNA(fMet)-specific endonuclease VapC [Pseudomonadota bacterium]|jgi:predicted nucleic acid-binding protein
MKASTKNSKPKAVALWGDLPQGATLVVDSAPLIYVLDEHPQFAAQFVDLFEAAESGDFQIAISTITVAEVLTGPYKAGQTLLAKRYERALLHYNVIAVSATIAVLAAQLRSRYRLKLPDAMQLATALDVGASAFVTHDADFSGVEGIRILTGN